MRKVLLALLVVSLFASMAIADEISHDVSMKVIKSDTAGNPVEFFVLPPKPEVIREDLADGSVECYIRGDDSYALGVMNADGTYSELFQRVGVDAFYGDDVSGSLSLGVFANSVYQGKMDVPYNINRRPPKMPVIKSNAEGFVSRGTVDVKITGSRGSDLYIAVSEPLTITEEELSYPADSELFKEVQLGSFRKIKGENYNLSWAQNGLNPVYYKVAAYSKNEENQSSTIEFAVIIDQSNYYFDATGDAALADGTSAHPFTQFSQLAEALEKQRVVKLSVKGEMKIDAAYNILANFEITDGGDARLKFGPDGSLAVKASTFEISDCRISNTADISKKSIVPLIKLENSVLTMKNCIIAADFARNGTVIDATNGIINLSETMASASAVSYVSFISAVKSRLNLRNSSISTNAETSVVISADGGNITAQKNEFLVSGGTGRIAELFGVTASFKENNFKARLTNSASKIKPIYVNKAAKLTEEKNSVQGF